MAVLAPPRTLRHPQHGESATFIQTAAESDGVRTIVHFALAPAGAGQALRHLTYDKQVEVLEGELTLRLGHGVCRLGPGETAVVPAGALHQLANDTLAPVAYLVDLEPGHTGFERALMASYGMAADGLVGRRGAPLNPYHLAIVLDWSETRLGGESEAMDLTLRMLSDGARRSGLDVRLAERYCAW